MQNRKVTRKEREFQRHRQEILKAALKIFSEGGFHGVTMNDIAKEAEFAVGTLYKFFKDKEDLYRVLLMEKVDEMDKVLFEAIESGKDEIAGIRGFLENIIRLVKKDVKFFRIYFAEIRRTKLNLPMELDNDLESRREYIMARLADLFKSGVKKKIFKKLDPNLLAIAFDGIIEGFISEYLMHGDRHPFDADTIMEIFFEPVLLDRNAQDSLGS